MRNEDRRLDARARRAEKEDAHAYRLRQAQKLLDLFAEANGRPAETVEELSTWLQSDEGRKATAYDRHQDGTIIP